MLARSFRLELDEYVGARKRAIARENRKHPEEPWGFPSDERDLIDRWRADPRTEEIWREIQAACETSISSADLIKTVLRARWAAIASENREYGSTSPDAWSKRLSQRAAKLSRLARSAERLGLDDKVSGFEQEAAQASQDARDLSAVSMPFSDHLGLPNQRKFELSRKAKWRTPNLFMQIVHDYLRQHSSRRHFDNELLEIVAVLTEIALDLRDIGADQVTTAVRARRKGDRSA
jgi:hypothetical protein